MVSSKTERRKKIVLFTFLGHDLKKGLKIYAIVIDVHPASNSVELCISPQIILDAKKLALNSIPVSLTIFLLIVYTFLIHFFVFLFLIQVFHSLPSSFIEEINYFTLINEWQRTISVKSSSAGFSFFFFHFKIFDSNIT